MNELTLETIIELNEVAGIAFVIEGGSITSAYIEGEVL